MRQRRYQGFSARSPPIPRVRARPYPPPLSRGSRISPLHHRRSDVEERRLPRRDFSPHQGHRKDYSPESSHHRGREYSPPPPCGRKYSPPPSRAREYSPPPPRGREYSPPLPRGRKYSPPPPQKYSPPPHGEKYSPPPPRGRKYSPPPPHGQKYAPPPPRGREYSPVLAHRHEDNRPLDSQRFMDSRNSMRVSSAKDVLEGKGKGKGLGSAAHPDSLERRHFEGRGERLQNKPGLSNHYGDSASTRFQWDHLLAEKQAPPGVNHARNIDAAYGSKAPVGLSPKHASPGYLNSGANASDKYVYDDVRAMWLEDSHLNYDKSIVQGSFKVEGDIPKLSFRDDLPQSSKTPTGEFYRDRFPLPSETFDRSSRLPPEGIGSDGYGLVPPVRSYEDDVIGEYAYLEGRRNVQADLSAIPDEHYYDRLASVREKYGLKDSFRSRSRDSMVHRTETVEDYGIDSAKENMPVDDQNYVIGTSHGRGQDDGRTRHGYGMESYQDGENPHLVEENGSKEDGSWLCGDGLKNDSLLDHEQDLYETDLRYSLTPEELAAGSVDQSERLLKRKHGFDKRRLGFNVGSGWSRNHIASDLSGGDEDWSKDSRLSDYRFRRLNVEKPYKRDSNKRSANNYLASGNLSAGRQRNLKKPGATHRDIKKRLGPPTNTHMYPWVRRKLQNDNQSHSNEEDNSSETVADVIEANKMDLAKVEPPEDSEEFKQLVNSAFLKFFKLLNENPAQRKKYTDHGRSGILKCGVCGRKSEEFVDTQCLVRHAFNSRVSGFRAEHLGLHKALCLLMGWNCAAAITSGSWKRQELPNAEALALREDLIIWPCVVVIHNSSITNVVPDERVILSIEGLKAILKEMGFGAEKVKVTRGKPANQSIMVVSFHATLSGLLEAEKLHKYFSEKRRGKVEFDKMINCSSNKANERKEGKGKAPVDDDEVSVLYGYLGVAEDLDKLDYETKKRCLVKSRKEIQHIMDAQLKCQ